MGIVAIRSQPIQVDNAALTASRNWSARDVSLKA